MKRFLAVCALAMVFAISAGAAETWRHAPLMDKGCASKGNVDAAAHPRSCALQCSKTGYGIIVDGKLVPFDETGNQRTLAALQASTRASNLRATVIGERHGDTIAVQSVTIE